MYALDTNTLVHAFQGKGRVLERLLEVPPAEVALPAVALYELEVGIAGSTAAPYRRNQLHALALFLRVLPFGASEARAAARIRVELEKAGQTIGPLDLLIAGTALQNGATLVTHNVREFSRVAGLQTEDWF
jgi:tRNA(fMet)-specific endonuclease VapC